MCWIHAINDTDSLQTLPRKQLLVATKFSRDRTLHELHRDERLLVLLADVVALEAS